MGRKDILGEQISLRLKEKEDKIVDGKILANGLASLKGKDLRMVYALLCKTHIGNLLSSKVKDTFSQETSNHFMQHLVEEVNKLKHIEDDVLQVNLFLELTKLLDLRGTTYTQRKEIEEQCERIVNGVYEQFRKHDKEFRSFTDNKIHPIKMQPIIQYQMKKIFHEIDGKFQEFYIDDQVKFADQVAAYLQKLPEEQQEQIKEKLGIDDVTNEVVRSVIARSGISIVFGIIVEVSGFAFYMMATSLFASTVGLLGVTLPFGFYTGLSSTIAVLASPIFIIPLLFIGGFFLLDRQNKSLREKLLPIILMQICLPTMSQGIKDISFHSFIHEWEKRFQKAVTLQQELGEMNKQIQQIQQHIFTKEQVISTCAKQIKDAEQMIEGIKNNLYASLKKSNLAEVYISEGFSTYKREYERVVREIESVKEKKRTRVAATGVRAWLAHKIEDVSVFIDVEEKTGEKEKVLWKMVEQVLLSNSHYKRAEREDVYRLRIQVKQANLEKQEAEQEKIVFKKTLQQFQMKQRNCKSAVEKITEENYGLEDLFVMA